MPQETLYPFDDERDVADAEHGFIAALVPGVVRNAAGEVVWDNDSYAFLTGAAPDTVHPSLWRQSMLIAKQGLFEVTEGIYQVRGLDLSNISFIEGDAGVMWSTRSYRWRPRPRRWACTGRTAGTARSPG
jgi:alkyl sulfatase BDS1-like metallo-beta-lactamase superfamily hydrolase